MIKSDSFGFIVRDRREPVLAGDVRLIFAAGNHPSRSSASGTPVVLQPLVQVESEDPV
jgi:hypothetical protein